jgi:putative endonuclease
MMEGGVIRSRLQVVMKKEFFCYMLRCSDGTYYTGWSTNPEKRVAIHNRGRGAKYTRSRLPVQLVYVETCRDKSAALKREGAIKVLSHAHKDSLLHKDYQKRSLKP